jgi:hypothetical protein
MSIDRDKEIYFKKLAHTISVAWLIQNLQARGPGKHLNPKFKFKAHMQEFLLACARGFS